MLLTNFTDAEPDAFTVNDAFYNATKCEAEVRDGLAMRSPSASRVRTPTRPCCSADLYQNISDILLYTVAPAAGLDGVGDGDGQGVIGDPADPAEPADGALASRARGIVRARAAGSASGTQV